ncbi:MAG: YaaA family protein [Acholeplasmataceae bacterium]
MIIILSPAKTFQRTNYEHKRFPFFQDEARGLNARISKMTVTEIEREMGVSKSIAQDVFAYSHAFGRALQPAIHSYYGAAYKALDAASLSDGDMRYAEEHLRILSALYGMLKPLDGISFYRLDYKDRILGDLYSYWRPKLSEYLSQESNNRIIVDLASQEFSRVLAGFDMVKISFKTHHKGKLRTMSMDAKRMRGAFARRMIERRIEDVRLLKEFDISGYRYADTHSNDREYVFIKEGE